MKSLWKPRLAVAVIMLVLSFIGMLVTDLHKEGSWDYWKWIVPVYAILALGLSAYTKKHREILTPVGVGHELLHWAALIGVIFLVSHMATLGVMSRFIAGIVHQLLLSLAIFLAGIYIESIFLIVGVFLGAFAYFTAVLVQYIYAIAIPILVGGALVVVIWVWATHKKTHA